MLSKAINKKAKNILYMLLKQGFHNISSFFNTTSSKTGDKKINLLLNIPYTKASLGNCGIGCVSMILKSKKIKSPTVIKLSKKYKKNNYYIKNVGWKHDGLVSILKEFGIDAYRKEQQTVSDLAQSLEKNKPIIVSLKVPSAENLSNDGTYKSRDKLLKHVGHLCVVVGINEGSIILHDPRNIGKYKKYLKININEFLKVFTQRCIYIA